jgi:hypothetical protein
MDAITAAAVAADHGAALPQPDDVHELEAVLRDLAEAVQSGNAVQSVNAVPSGNKAQEPGGLPADQRLSPITDAVQRVQAVLAG